MISELSSATSDLINAVLDASMLRHKIISNNVANHNVKDFSPSNVNFEALLREELDEKINLKNSDSLRRLLGNIEPEIGFRYTENIVGENNKSLEYEMTEMAKNTLRYESLIKAKSLASGIMSMAISGTRK